MFVLQGCWNDAVKAKKEGGREAAPQVTIAPAYVSQFSHEQCFLD